MDPLTLYIKKCATSHKTLQHDNIHNVLKLSNRAQGRVQDFRKGGSNISWFPKKGHHILKGGVQWSEGGGPVHLSH